MQLIFCRNKDIAYKDYSNFNYSKIDGLLHKNLIKCYSFPLFVPQKKKKKKNSSRVVKESPSLINCMRILRPVYFSCMF